MLSKKKFVASDECVAWAESLSGMLTKIKTTYGGIGEMVESPEWNESKTVYFLQLLKGLRRQLATIDKELSEHVKGKGG
jgi:transcription termination factor NusB